MFGLIRKKKVKDAIEHILNRYNDFKKDDPLFNRYGDQYYYYMGNQNAANYIAWKCGIDKLSETDCHDCYYATKINTDTYRCRRKKYDVEKKTCFVPRKEDADGDRKESSNATDRR